MILENVYNKFQNINIKFKYFQLYIIALVLQYI